MSLVAYGSSDESENEDEYNEEPRVDIATPAASNVNKSNKSELHAKDVEKVGTSNGKTFTDIKTAVALTESVNTGTKLHLPTPKTEQQQFNNDDNENLDEEVVLNFGALPRPKTIEITKIKEEDSAPISNKVDYGSIEKPPKKEKGPTKISIPSLSDFKDIDEEEESSKYKIKPSKKGSGLIGILPPPKGSVISTKSTIMVPHVLTKKPTEPKSLISHSVDKTIIKNPVNQAKPCTSTLKSLSSYNSDSEDEDDKEASTDFFSLTTPAKIPEDQLIPISTIDISDITDSSSSNILKDSSSLQLSKSDTNKILKNNVMDIPKEEIILKNKAEVGPKLPVPEQEYHLDSKGNVAFDDKAIEYLCGRRGVKRKNELSNIDIVEISGDDIKPDEREWLVKALTEEQVHRPLSINSGPGGQSKKKHQITYLAHQAKAMELELKNQWAQNKANRQQTRSKYGF